MANKIINDKNQQEDTKTNESAPSLKDVAGSVAAAFIGVQSNKNRERDFSKGKFSHFVLIGLLAVLLFVGVLVTIVSFVLPN